MTARGFCYHYVLQSYTWIQFWICMLKVVNKSGQRRHLTFPSLTTIDKTTSNTWPTFLSLHIMMAARRPRNTWTRRWEKMFKKIIMIEILECVKDGAYHSNRNHNTENATSQMAIMSLSIIISLRSPGISKQLIITVIKLLTKYVTQYNKGASCRPGLFWDNEQNSV